VDEEPEAQVVQRQVLEVTGQAATRPQALAQAPDDRDAVAIVADEGDEAVLLGAGGRLADVVHERAEAQRRAAAHLVGERLGEERLQLLRPLAPEPPQVRLDRERLLEHRHRVPVDVEVVVGALFDPAQRLQLRQDDRGEAELVEQRHPAQRVRPADELAQLRELALSGGLGP
jgi:hypothetical protein